MTVACVPKVPVYFTDYHQFYQDMRVEVPKLKCLTVEGYVDDQMLELLKYLIGKSKDSLKEFKIESPNSYAH